MLAGLFALFWLGSAREQLMLSSHGLSIVCSVSGAGTTIESSDYSSLNSFPEADWIWSSTGIVSNEHCNITFSFLVHSITSSISLSVSTPGSSSFYVNGALRTSIANGTIGCDSCFSNAGYHTLTVKVLHGTGAFGVAFNPFREGNLRG